jgi:diguanylate cyclase (GGDEF)-like protein
VDWEGRGDFLYFISTHEEVMVEADGVVLFERHAVQTLWGHSAGFAREFVEIPSGTREVTVTVNACYPALRNSVINFYHGYGLNMFRSILKNEGLNIILSLVNVCLGVLLFGLGVAVRKRTTIGSAMIYLGLFALMMGVWSVSDNGITAFLVKNRAASSFLSFASLTTVGIPLVMFVNRYLQPEDKYVHKVILGLNLFNATLVYAMQFLGIRDMKQTVLLTHIAMLSACAYLPFALIHMLRKRLLTRQFWVTVCSLLTMCPSMAYSLYMYYNGSHTVDGYGNIMVFVFIAIFAVDVARSVMREVDAGKKAAIYRELAVTDLLTGCYNRNAYRNDTKDWENLNDVLLVTCDLNNLKQCNDTLGHTYGDQYITDSANMLKRIFSDYGKVYRIGGDEFCIIIPDSHRYHIDVLLASLTEAQRIYNLTSEVINLQIACGYAKYDKKTDSTMEDIRIRADERMYENKKELKAAAAAAAAKNATTTAV